VELGKLTCKKEMLQNNKSNEKRKKNATKWGQTAPSEHPPDPTHNQMKPAHIRTPNFLKDYFNIIPISTSSSSPKWSTAFRISGLIFSMQSDITRTLQAPYSGHVSLILSS
jgi:hypothetical protein